MNIREEPFVDKIVDYTIPFTHERCVILSHVTNDMEYDLFSYFMVFDINVWSVLMISIFTIILIVSIFHDLILIERKLTFKLILDFLFKLYANCLSKGIK